MHDGREICVGPLENLASPWPPQSRVSTPFSQSSPSAKLPASNADRPSFAGAWLLSTGVATPLLDRSARGKGRAPARETPTGTHHDSAIQVTYARLCSWPEPPSSALDSESDFLHRAITVDCATLAPA